MKKMKQFNTLKLFRKYYFVVLMIGILLLTSFIANLTFSSSEPKRNISDEARIEDLHTIELAINKYISGKHNIPQKLSELNLTALHGRLNDYEYKDFESTYHGGEYTLCASFQSEGEKNPEEDFTYAGIEAYKFHDKGHSCFRNSIYKGGSHIKPL